MYPCPRQIESDFVPIGKPIDNIKIHILNSEMRPVKMADVGELYIEGGLARGYVNRLEPVSYTHLDVYKRQRQPV